MAEGVTGRGEEIGEVHGVEEGRGSGRRGSGRVSERRDTARSYLESCLFPFLVNPTACNSRLDRTEAAVQAVSALAPSRSLPLVPPPLIHLSPPASPALSSRRTLPPSPRAGAEMDTDFSTLQQALYPSYFQPSSPSPLDPDLLHLQSGLSASTPQDQPRTLASPPLMPLGMDGGQYGQQQLNQVSLPAVFYRRLGSPIKFRTTRRNLFHKRGRRSMRVEQEVSAVVREQQRTRREEERDCQTEWRGGERTPPRVPRVCPGSYIVRRQYRGSTRCCGAWRRPVAANEAGGNIRFREKRLEQSY